MVAPIIEILLQGLNLHLLLLNHMNQLLILIHIHTSPLNVPSTLLLILQLDHHILELHILVMEGIEVDLVLLYLILVFSDLHLKLLLVVYVLVLLELLAHLVVLIVQFVHLVL